MNTSAISVEIEGARIAKNVPVVSCVCGRGRWDVSSSARVSGSGSLSLAVIGKYTVAQVKSRYYNKTNMANLVTRARWRNPSRFFLFCPGVVFLFVPEWCGRGTRIYESTVRLYKRFQLWSPQCHRGNGAVVISR